MAKRTDIKKILIIGSGPIIIGQDHPESAPGPQDSAYLFDEFIAMMEGK